DFSEKNLYFFGNNFENYLLYSLKLISMYFYKIYSFNHILLKRLFEIVDTFWFIGLNIFFKTKNYKNFKKFLLNFKHIFFVVFIIIKLLFDKNISDEKFFYDIFDCFGYIMPKSFI